MECGTSAPLYPGDRPRRVSAARYRRAKSALTTDAPHPVVALPNGADVPSALDEGRQSGADAHALQILPVPCPRAPGRCSFLRLRAHGIDPDTGGPDPHGVPQIVCPARQDDVNPQFTCRRCPCAAGVETHEAVDDLGQPFHVVNCVECAFEDRVRKLPTVWQRFTNPLAGVVKGALPRTEPGVACPLPALGLPVPPSSLRLGNDVWVPVSRCRLCQFHRGIEGEIQQAALGGSASAVIVCSAPGELFVDVDLSS